MSFYSVSFFLFWFYLIHSASVGFSDLKYYENSIGKIMSMANKISHVRAAIIHGNIRKTGKSSTPINPQMESKRQYMYSLTENLSHLKIKLLRINVINYLWLFIDRCGTY